MSPGMEEAMKGLRRWMFENVYESEIPKAEEGKAKRMIEHLFCYYMDYTQQLPQEYLNLMENGEKKERAVCDYIAGMSDSYAIDKFEELFVPRAWK